MQRVSTFKVCRQIKILVIKLTKQEKKFITRISSADGLTSFETHCVKLRVLICVDYLQKGKGKVRHEGPEGE
jgi:hypothetical protein